MAYVLELPIASVEEKTELPSRTYCLDLDAGRIVGYVDGKDAVKQAIRKALITPRWKCLIYDNQYGSEIEDAFIRNDASEEYIEAAAEGFVKDALLPDKRILDVHDFEIEFGDDAAYIKFTADTIYGEVVIEEDV